MAGTITHSWNGTILTITSDSGTTAMDLKGEKGDTGARGVRGLPGKAGGGARIEDGVISDETTWSSSGIVDRFAELMGTNANPAVLDNPYPNYPLQITTTFEPKQEGSGNPSPDNIRPISGWTGAKLTRCGKNLFDKDSAMLNSWYSYSPEIPNAQPFDGVFASKLIPVRPGEVFTLTNYITGEGYGLVKYLVSETDTGGISSVRGEDVITCDGTKQVYTFTVPAKVRYIGITGDMANIDKVQLELGSTATTYEPYKGDTYTIGFGNTYYGGTLDWNTGVLTVDRALYTFDGSENFVNGGWNNPYSYVRWDLFPDVVKYQMSVVADAYCSHYAVGSVGYVITNEIAGFGIYDRGHMIFSSPTHADVDAFKSYLAAQHAAGTPVQVCYKLATPQTIQLTPQEIKAIKGINTLYSNAQELTVIGRVDTMYQLSKLAERVAALEAR